MYSATRTKDSVQTPGGEFLHGNAFDNSFFRRKSSEAQDELTGSEEFGNPCNDGEAIGAVGSVKVE